MSARNLVQGGHDGPSSNRLEQKSSAEQAEQAGQAENSYSSHDRRKAEEQAAKLTFRNLIEMNVIQG